MADLLLNDSAAYFFAGGWLHPLHPARGCPSPFCNGIAVMSAAV